MKTYRDSDPWLSTFDYLHIACGISYHHKIYATSFLHHLLSRAPAQLVNSASTLLVPLGLGDPVGSKQANQRKVHFSRARALHLPESFLVAHDVSQDGTAQKDHVLAARRVLDSDLEFLRVEEIERMSILSLV